MSTSRYISIGLLGAFVASPSFANTLGDPMAAAFSRFRTCAIDMSERLDVGQEIERLIDSSEAACNRERAAMFATLDWREYGNPNEPDLAGREAELRARVLTHRQILASWIRHRRTSHAPNP